MSDEDNKPHDGHTDEHASPRPEPLPEPAAPAPEAHAEESHAAPAEAAPHAEEPHHEPAAEPAVHHEVEAVEVDKVAERIAAVEAAKG